MANLDVFAPADRAFVFRVVRRILRVPELADDATQDALLLAHRHRARFHGTASPRSWLYRIAVRSALSHLRKVRRTRRYEELSSDGELDTRVGDGAASPEALASARELVAAAAGVYAALEPASRAVFACALDDLSMRETSAELAISVANAKVRTFRVRQRLRAELADHRRTTSSIASAATRGASSVAIVR